MTLTKRVVARRCLAFVAALAVTATLSAAARAQESGTSPDTTAEPVLTTTTEAPPVRTAPLAAAPVSSSPLAAPAASSPTAAAAKLAISATVGAGPFLIGEQVPVEVTISNTGDADATNVMADGYTSTGSNFFIQSSQWGDLATWPGPGITLAAGQQRVLTVRGEAQTWSGAPPVVRFSIWQGNAWVTDFTLPIPMRDPNSARDTLAGLIYGDRNGNGTPDAGEGLAGVHVNVSTYGGPDRVDLDATTDADGRFRFADLTSQVYTLYISDEPDGWVVEPAYSRVVVDGSGSAANMLLRGERPLTDQLSAAMRFTRDAYQVGDRAEIAVTLTNSGAADLTGIKAGCDRSGGEGPELRDVVAGDLEWDAPGVTVPAGQSVVLTISGSISSETAEYGAVGYGCDFGPREDVIDGRPGAYALAKVPGPAVTVRMSFHHDRDGDQVGEPDEMVGGLVVVLRDAITRQVVAEGRTDAQGRARFENVPSGPYDVRVYGSWKFGPYDSGRLFAGTCWNCQAERSFSLLPGPDPTNARRVDG